MWFIAIVLILTSHIVSEVRQANEECPESVFLFLVNFVLVGCAFYCVRIA